LKELVIDINADVAEGIGNERELMPYISSCNICCGAHAGNARIMEETIQIATDNEVTIGAHPSYPDKTNFGRIPMEISQEELINSIRSQLDLLFNLTAKQHTAVSYIKPHGALYHQAANKIETAELLITILKEYDKQLVLLGLAGSAMQQACIQSNISFAAEAFADRAYNADGSLVSRKEPGAVYHTIEQVWPQVSNIITKQRILSNQQDVHIHADSICFHGDTANAIALVKQTNTLLKQHHITLKPFAR